MQPVNMPFTAFSQALGFFPWEKMPDEVTLLVLQYLSVTEQATFALTCRRFYRFSLDKELKDLQQHRFFIAIAKGKKTSLAVAQAMRALCLPPQVSRLSKIFLVTRALVPMENLTELTVQGGAQFVLGKRGMHIMAVALEALVHLRRLDVGGNCIGDEGAEALASVLTKMQGLVTLCIKDNLLDSRGIGYLQGSLRQLPVLRELDISGNYNPAESVAALLSELPSLRNLDICSTKGGAEEEIGALANSLSRMEDLQELSLGSFDEMEEDALSSLGRALGELKRLKRLYFYQMSEGTLQILALYLSRIQTLTKLCIHRSNLSTHDIAAVASALCHMPELKKVDFSNMWESSPLEGAYFFQPFFDAFAHMNSLTALDFSKNSLGNLLVGQKFTCMRQLRKLNLSFLKLMWSEIPDLAERLKEMVFLEELQLQDNPIIASGAQALAQAMPFLSHLKVFTATAALANSSEVIQNWIACLTHLPQLTELIFEVDEMLPSSGKFFLQKEDAENLGAILSRMHNLTKLRLTHLTNTPQATQTLIEGLGALKRLKVLELRSNHIGEEGADTLEPVLKSMEHLTDLTLEECQLGSRGMQALVGPLVSLRDLRNLNLGKNNIEDAGMEAVVKAIPWCTQLKGLRLHDNNIKDLGALALAQGLPKILYLDHLDIGQNKITARGMQALVSVLSNKLHLQCIVIYDNPLGEEGFEALSAAFDHALEIDSYNTGYISL